MSVITPHSMKQQRAIFSQKRILLLGTGTQWGKTEVGAIRMKMKIAEFNSKRDNFIITAPTYKTLHQSTLPRFLTLMDGLGEYNSKFDEFRLNTGGTVFCRTERDPDSIVGITNVRHIWGDEAGKYRLYFWENMQARADLLGCGIDLTTSPYSMNWIPKELIKPTEKGLRDDVEHIQAASWENPYHSLHDQTKRDHKKSTMDARRFDMLYGGVFGKMVGLVYDCFDESLHVVQQTQLPPGTIYFGGIDWGYTDPFVLTVRAITPTGHHFTVSGFYKTGMTLPEMMTIANQKKSIFGIKKFYAGPDQPGYIEEFNRNGLPCEPANNDIRKGIDLHYELIRTGKYKAFQGAHPHLIDEYASYHYPEPEELEPDQDSKEQNPVGQNDHCMDAERYTTIMTYKSSIPKHTPKTPQEIKKLNQMDQEKRLQHLKRKSRQYHGSESW